MATVSALILCGSTLDTQAAQGLEWCPGIRPLDSPAVEESAQPLSVSARGVLLSWVESTGKRATLKFAERNRHGLVRAGRRRIGRRLVRELGGRPLGDPIVDDGTLAAHWLQKSGSFSLLHAW